MSEFFLQKYAFLTDQATDYELLLTWSLASKQPFLSQQYYKFIAHRNSVHANTVFSCVTVVLACLGLFWICIPLCNPPSPQVFISCHFWLKITFTLIYNEIYAQFWCFFYKIQKRHKSTLTLQPVCYFRLLWDIKMWSGNFNQAEIFIPKFWPFIRCKVKFLHLNLWFCLPQFQLPWPIKPLFFWEVWHHIAECCRGRKRDIDARRTFFHHFFRHVSEETLRIFLCTSSFSYRNYLLPD